MLQYDVHKKLSVQTVLRRKLWNGQSGHMDDLITGGVSLEPLLAILELELKNSLNNYAASRTGNLQITNFLKPVFDVKMEMPVFI